MSKEEEKKSVGKKENSKKLLVMICGVAFIVATVIIICVVLSKGRVMAATMRLVAYEGEISLTGESEKELSVTENAKLYSGNVLSTKIASKGHISLDDTKLVTLEELSRADFEQEGKKLALHLSEGSLFFNVTEKLTDEESFDIRTSTMLIGIRGTSGYVNIASETKEQVWITDGETHVSVTHPMSGAVDEADVEGGKHLTVIYNDDGTIDMQIDDIPYIGSLPADAIEEVFANISLLERVSEAAGWSEEDVKDRTRMGKISTAIEVKAVDGIEHAAYYSYEKLPEWVESWLDDTVAACDDQDWDEAFSLLQDGSLDRIWQLGFNDHIYYNGYKIWLTYSDDERKNRGLRIIPEGEGMGYAITTQYNSKKSQEQKIYAYCPCVDGMYNGDAYFCHMFEGGSKGTIHIINFGKWRQENL